MEGSHEQPQHRGLEYLEQAEEDGTGRAVRFEKTTTFESPSSALKSGSGASTISIVESEYTPLTAMQHHMIFPPEESVYSYLMFMAPIEQRRQKHFCTHLIVFALILVLVNFVMQVGLLYVVGQHIMRKHTEWVGQVAKIKDHAWYHIMPMPYNEPDGKCRGKDSPLCFPQGDGISCSPLSVEILTDWQLLDTNGDGMWSRDEAEDESLRDKIQCEFNVDLPDLYNHTIQNLQTSAGLMGRQDQNLVAGMGVHKAYLNWYLHKPLLCTYGDQDMCGALFERGIFDEALRMKSSFHFKDTASALKYCNDILQYECYNMLPNTYKVWRFVSNQQCGQKLFSEVDYQPTHGAAVPMLKLDFRKRKEYAATKTFGFRLFLGILLVTFLSVMALEMRSIIRSFMFCFFFPADTGGSYEGSPRIVGKESVQLKKVYSDNDSDEGTISKTIKGVRGDHRCLVFIMTVLRLMLWCFLMWSGVMFLTGPPRFLTLIFDALSLVFILEIDELLYKTMLRHEFTKDHMDIEPMKVPQWHQGWISGWLNVTADILWFLSVITLGVVIVVTYCKTELNPLLDSLECLCSAQGPKCNMANYYTKSWWDSYWANTLPASNMIINGLQHY